MKKLATSFPKAAALKQAPRLTQDCHKFASLPLARLLQLPLGLILTYKTCQTPSYKVKSAGVNIGSDQVCLGACTGWPVPAGARPCTPKWVLHPKMGHAPHPTAFLCLHSRERAEQGHCHHPARAEAHRTREQSSPMRTCPLWDTLLGSSPAAAQLPRRSAPCQWVLSSKGLSLCRVQVHKSGCWRHPRAILAPSTGNRC